MDTSTPPYRSSCAGEGAYIWDDKAKKYLAGLFVTNIDHGRNEIGEAAARQIGQLAFFPIWTFAHPRARTRQRCAATLMTHPGRSESPPVTRGSTQADE